MKKRCLSVLLALCIVLPLMPTAALAAETAPVDASEIHYYEESVIDPRFPPVSTIDPSEAAPADNSETAPVDASEIRYYEESVIDPRFPPVSTIDNSENDPNAVQLSDKRAAKCIDRVKLPQFARDFYETLVMESKPANTSGLGRDGFLINPSNAPSTLKFSDGPHYVVPVPYPTEAELRRAGFQFEDPKEFVENTMRVAFYALHWDHPEVFWLRGLSAYNDTRAHIYYLCLARVGYPEGVWEIRQDDYRDPDVIKRCIYALNASVASIVNTANRKSSNYEKIEYFNEWLTTNNQYNYTVAYTNDPVSHDVYEVVSALTTKDGHPGGGRSGVDGPVCSGYARAFQLLCQQVNIPCVQVNGLGHAWNYVQVDPLDSRWYAVDVTWNDPIMGGTSTPTLNEYENWGGRETTAYTLVGADTIVYDGRKETFLEQHPAVNQSAGSNFVLADFRMGPELNRFAYVDRVSITGLDAPVKGAVPDTRAALTSDPKNGHTPNQAGTKELFTNPNVTWSPALKNGTFAADTVYTATITYTSLRQGYGLTAADASKITAAGAARVTVNASGAIQVVFPRTEREAGSDSGELHGKVTISTADFSSPIGDGVYVTANQVMTLHAVPDPGYRVESVQVVTASGRTLPLSQNGNDYSFVMPASDVVVHIKFISADG